MRLPYARADYFCFVAIFVPYAFFLTLSQAASCNTNQNPTCVGDTTLESICCTYPNICYWSNRDGTPACCPKGKDCRQLGGPAPNQVSYTPSPVTLFQQTTLYVTQLSTTTVIAAPTTSYRPASTTVTSAAGGTTFNTVTTNAVIIVTQTAATSNRVTTINGQFVTVTQVASARKIRAQICQGILVRLATMIFGLLFTL